MKKAFIDAVTTYPWLVLVLCAGLIGGAGAGLQHIGIAANMDVFFAPDDPQFLTYDEMRNTYVRDDNLLIAIKPENGNVFTPSNLQLIEELTEAAWLLPFAIRVDSITNYQHTQAAGDDLTVSPLVEDASTLTPEQIARVQEIALTEPSLRGKLVSEVSNMASVFISLEIPGEKKSEGTPAVVGQGRELRDRMKEKYPGVEILISGKIAGDNAFTESAINDAATIVPTALGVALFCIAAYFFRASGNVATGIYCTLATIAVIVASVLTALGLAGWLGIPISSVSSSAPTIILTLAVADSMHVLVTCFQAMRRGEDRLSAMRESLRLNFQAVFLTSLTTIIGFMALNFSESPPFHDLGNMVSMGIAAAWFYSITLLPALLVILPIRSEKGGNEDVNGLTTLARWVIANRHLSLGVSTTLVCIALVFIPRNEFYDVWAEYFDPSTEIRYDSDTIREHLAGMNSMEFHLRASEPGAVVDPEYLQVVEDFSNALRAHPNVTHVISFADVMKRLNKNMHGDDESWYRIPEEREMAAQYLLLYEFSLPFGLGLNTQVDIDKSATRLIASARGSSTREMLDLQAFGANWLKENAPEYMHHSGASRDAMFAHIGKRNAISMTFGSAAGLVLISCIIGLALRSFRFSLVSLFANLLPIAVGFGVWGLMVGRIGMGLSVVSGVTMGVVVDYTVHLLTKYNKAKIEQNLSTEDALVYAFSTVGMALVITTVILCANFGTLFFSLFVLNAELGILTAGIIGLALLVDFFLLPPLMLLLWGNEKISDAGHAGTTA